MSRTTTTSFNNALAQTVTSVGYLVEIDFGGSPTTYLRWCDLGQQSYNGFTWSAMDFEVAGFAVTVDGLGVGGISLKVQNLDSGVVAEILADVSKQTAVRIWQIARDVGSPGDAPLLADMVSDGVDCGLDFVTFKLIPRVSRYAYAPRKRCDPANGFNNALPPGTQIMWQGEIIIVEGEVNG